LGAPASEQPRIRVAAAIVAAGGLVVVTQHKHDASYALLPGGGVGWGEPLAEALQREVMEEIGLPIAVERLLLVNDSIAPDGSKHVVSLTFSARPLSSLDGLAPRDPAIDAVRTVPLDRLPNIDLRPPIGRELAEALMHGGPSSGARYLGALWVPSAGPARGRGPEGQG
jgi:ADP-ribose pyrophosphatase YjhB (NUDIX family)